MATTKGRLVVLGSTLAAAGLLASLVPSGASSHREAPLIAQDPVADATDVYAFVAPDRPGAVNIIANYVPLQNPASGPYFHRFGEDVLYQIHVDNNGDAVEDITYEFKFENEMKKPASFTYNDGVVDSPTDENYNFRQNYSLARIDRDANGAMRRTQFKPDQRHPIFTTPPYNVGPRSTPNYAAIANQSNYSFNGGGSQVFAGVRDDPFFVDLGSIFDLGGLRPLNQAHLIKLPTATGKDAVARKNVHTLALQIPIPEIIAGGRAGGPGPSGPDDPKAVIGVWTEARRQTVRNLDAGGGRPTVSGEFVDVSRLGNPLVNELIIPIGDRDKWNASDPVNDEQFAKYVQDPELGKLIEVLYPGVKVPPAPRNDLVTIFLTGIPGLNQPQNVKPAEMLRLNLAIPPRAFGQENRLGVLGGDNAGFPNGRRLGDDVVDIALRAVAGGTPFTPEFNKAPNNILGDGVDGNEKRLPLPAFPYVEYAWSGYDVP